MLEQLAEIELNDLVSDCQECNARGLVIKRTGNSFMGLIEEVTCPTCKGEKLLLTDLGKVLAAFVEKLRRAGRLR